MGPSMENNPRTFAVIIAGGAGTRLWPLSRRTSPKPFLPGKDGRSLLRATFERALHFTALEKILVVVAASLVDKVSAELPEVPLHNILGEPTPRNTAAAIGLAASVIEQRDPEALFAVLPADHIIADEEAFASTARQALSLAAGGEVVTLGISPTRPETGYGYLWLAASLGPQQFVLRQFVEKPSLEKAREFVASGQYLWNSGTFFFAAKTLLRAIEAHLPTLAVGLVAIMVRSKETDLSEALHTFFGGLPSISIDYGIMEKLPRIVCVSAHCGWDDIGTLASYAELAPSITPIEIKAQGNVYLGQKKTVSVIGADDLIIVETDDALVICRRQESQAVKDLVALLEKSDKKGLL
jgi:mannose-1-phosphate guanylyltransferase